MKTLITILIALFLSSLISAQTVVFGDSTSPQKATSIEHLVVEGTSYDVVFEISTYADFYFGVFPGTYTFNSITSAEAAVDEINSALNDYDAINIGNLDTPYADNKYSIPFESLVIGADSSLKLWRAYRDDNDVWLSLGVDTINYYEDKATFAIFTLITDLDDDHVADIPNAYKLYSNYPNPFNPETTIEYQLSTVSQVRLDIYNALGEWITTIVNGEQTAGLKSVRWNGTNSNGMRMGSGVYFYRIVAGNFVETKQMILLK